MSIEATTNGESASTQGVASKSTIIALEAPADPKLAAAFKADSALDPRQRGDIAAAWKLANVGADESTDESTDAEPAPEAEAEAEVELEPEADEPEAKPAKPAKAKPEAAAPKTKLTQAENHTLMQARIAQNAKFQRREQAQTQKFQEREAAIAARAAEIDTKYTNFTKAQQAIESGDFDGIAKALGYDDWNKLNSNALEAVQSPVYKQMRALQKAQEERDRKDADLQSQYQAQAAQAQAQAVQQEWKDNLRDECIADDDPAVAALVEARPDIVNALFSIQRTHYDKTAGDELSARDAVAQYLDAVRKDYDFWSSFYEEHSESELLGNQAASTTSAKPAKASVRATTLERQTGKKTAGAGAKVREAPSATAKAKVIPKSISQAQTSGASQDRKMNEKELKDHYAALMREEQLRQAS